MTPSHIEAGDLMVTSKVKKCLAVGSCHERMKPLLMPICVHHYKIFGLKTKAEFGQHRYDSSRTGTIRDDECSKSPVSPMYNKISSSDFRAGI